MGKVCSHCFEEMIWHTTSTKDFMGRSGSNGYWECPNCKEREFVEKYFIELK